MTVANEENDKIGTHEVTSDSDAARSSSTTQSSPESEFLHPLNPLKDASVWSRIFFLWAYPLVRLGRERPLEDTDLATLMEVDSSVYQSNHLNRLWKNEKETTKDRKRKPSLARALFIDYWGRTRWARCLLIGNMASRLVQTIALGRVLRFLEETESGTSTEGYAWAALLVACGLIAFPTKQQQFFQTYRIGMQLRMSLVAAIYSKILRLPSISSETYNVTSGHITNLASNDVERFLATSVYSNFIVLGPLEAIVILGMGIYIVGPVFCVGYALLCLLVPFQFYLSRRFAVYRDSIANQTDARVSWVSQAVYGARIMKQSGFEPMFLDRITQQRGHEISQLQTTASLKALNEAIYFISSAVVASLIFCVHVAMGGTLTPEIVYTTLNLLNILQFTLTKHIPNAIMGLSECSVSCQRIQTLLEHPEVNCIHKPTASQTINQSDTTKVDEDEEALLSLSSVTCYWDSTPSNFSHNPTKVALSNISLNFYPGKLYCVIGPIGSGKSALLQTLLGELSVFSGSIWRRSHSFSYAAQESWIMDGTIQENILMGLNYGKGWYSQVIEACALDHDLEHFPHGDRTIVGDRGIQISGGQKARIGLARAFYKHDAEVLLLDDPLSAVDAKVGKTIFFSAIQKLGVQRGKCVVLVTHQHQFVGMADHCIVMDQCKLISTGTFDDCQACVRRLFSKNSIQMVEAHHEEESDPTFLPGRSSRVVKESQDEKRVTGMVKLETWISYAKALGGYPVCGFLFLVFVTTQGALLSNLLLLGMWGERSRDKQQTTRWFAIIGGTTAALISLTIFRAQLSFYILIRCSRKLHDEMTRAVLHAKISFFDTNPLGRILNRFSADVGIVDEILPLTVYDFLVGATMFVGSVCTAIAVLPFVLLVLPLLAYCFLRFRCIFVGTTRELKRLEGLARSPMYAMLSETMLGISTIRANEATNFFLQKFSRAHDKHSRAAWAFMSSSRWFAISLDMLSFLLLTTATFVSVLLHHQEWFDVEPATLGLALTLLVQMANTNFPWMVRQSAEVTNQMVSVERILEFCGLEPEAPQKLDSDQELGSSWPMNGSIQVENLSVRYRTGLPLALDSVSFAIEKGSKVGIVGRTGSGKSTLVQALFRLLEADDGKITVDGVDIARVGLHRLRKRISVIPQVPTLFSGCTIRENLDLFAIHSDDEIHRAIQNAHLEAVVGNLPLGVHSMVSEGGSNFSVGQRQLLCLARAILSKNKILILDEATANVDRRTDSLIHETLQRSFSDGTIIAVAHRLETIMNADSVIVMGNARVLEQGSPNDLLVDKSSHFSAMAKSGGYQ